MTIKAMLLLFISLSIVNSTVVMSVQNLYTTESIFNVTVNVNNETSVTISGSNTISGTLTKPGSSGAATVIFTGLRVNTAGSITILATGSTNTPTGSTNTPTSLNSATVAVSAAIRTLSLTISSSKVVANVPFTLTVNIVDQYNSPWIENVSLQISDGMNNYQGTATSGAYTNKITYTSAGSYLISVTDDQNNVKTQTLTVTALSISATLMNTNVKTSTDLMNILVQLDYSSDVIATITLKCNTSCSGTNFRLIDSTDIVVSTTITLTGPAGYLQNVYVLSSGTFTWQVNVPGYPTASTTAFSITNSVKNVAASYSSNSVSAFFPIQLNVNVTGDDENLFLLPVTVTILDASGYSNVSSANLDITQGSAIVNLYYTLNISGAYYTMTTNETSITKYASSSINVQKNTLAMVNQTGWLPTNTKESFLFVIKVMDNSGKFLENDYGKHNLTMALNPSGSFSGTQQTVTTSGGEATINNLIIADSGDFQLLILCDSCETYTTQEFTVDGTDCRVGGGPISCACILIFFGIVSAVLFSIADKDVQFYRKSSLKGCVYHFFLIHPFLSIFIRQPRFRRILVAMQLFTAEVLMLTVIGGIYAYYDSPTQRYEVTFTDYYGRQLYKGGTGWALAQFGIIPIFYLNFYSIGNAHLIKWTVGICLLLTTLCFGAMIGMTIEYCIGYSAVWTANFLIYLLFDFVLMQTIFTLLAICLMPKDVRDALEPREIENADATDSMHPEKRSKKDKKNRRSNLDDEEEEPAQFDN